MILSIWISAFFILILESSVEGSLITKQAIRVDRIFLLRGCEDYIRITQHVRLKDKVYFLKDSKGQFIEGATDCFSNLKPGKYKVITHRRLISILEDMSDIKITEMKFKCERNLFWEKLDILNFHRLLEKVSFYDVRFEKLG